MRLLVTGGRDFVAVSRLRGVLDAVDRKHGITVLIQGGAAGADALAADWAREKGIPVTTFVADWACLGKAAGPVRNQAMITEGKPQAAVAFPRADGTWGRGTMDMRERLKEAGIACWAVETVVDAQVAPSQSDAAPHAPGVPSGN